MDWDVRRDADGFPEAPETITPELMRQGIARGRHAGYKPDPLEGLRGWVL
jgi:hypothetical protein